MRPKSRGIRGHWRRHARKKGDPCRVKEKGVCVCRCVCHRQKELIHVELTNDDDSWRKGFAQKKVPIFLHRWKTASPSNHWLSGRSLLHHRWNSLTPRGIFESPIYHSVHVFGGNWRTWSKQTTGDTGTEPQTFLLWADRGNPTNLLITFL